MTSKTRKPLEPWQIDDAARLKSLFEQRSRLSQDAFGAEYDIGTQGMVWQYINGHVPLNLAAAIKFARGLGLHVADISPTLAKDLGDTNQSDAAAIGQIIEGLPENDRQLALDFIQYRVERNETLFAKEQYAHYMTMITNIRADMASKRDNDDKPQGGSNTSTD